MPKSQAAISTCVFAARAEPVTKPTSMTRGCAHRQILPRPSGYELFQYLDDAGERHTVSSTEVNAYLHEITGEEITAKDFRTWAGTNLAALALREFEHIDSGAMRKRAIGRAVERVARHLGNTPAVC